MPDLWYVYMVECSPVNGGHSSLYCGMSTDVRARVASHNAGTGAKYTRSRRPVALVWWVQAGDRKTAARLELKVKAMPVARKRELVEGFRRAGAGEGLSEPSDYVVPTCPRECEREQKSVPRRRRVQRRPRHGKKAIRPYPPISREEISDQMEADL